MQILPITPHYGWKIPLTVPKYKVIYRGWYNSICGHVPPCGESFEYLRQSWRIRNSAMAKLQRSWEVNKWVGHYRRLIRMILLRVLQFAFTISNTFITSVHIFIRYCMNSINPVNKMGRAMCHFNPCLDHGASKRLSFLLLENSDITWQMFLRTAHCFPRHSNTFWKDVSIGMVWEKCLDVQGVCLYIIVGNNAWGVAGHLSRSWFSGLWCSAMHGWVECSPERMPCFGWSCVEDKFEGMRGNMR